MHILIIKTSSMGDIIHCLPVINDILLHYPYAKIDWVVEDSFADIPRMHPKINQVFTVAIRRWRGSIFKESTWKEVSKFKHSLDAYDVVIDCQGLTKSAVISLLTKGPRHGFDWRSGRDPFASIFYNKKHKVSLLRDAVARNRALCALALGYVLPNATPNYGISSNKPEKPMDIDLQGKYIIAFHATSRDSKLWPVTSWVAIGKALAKMNLNLVLPWVSDAELYRANEIARQLSTAKVLPKLNITQLAPIIAQAQAAIGV
ncbi:MAG: lipopolysaccharide heptosyltransferase I, partial [Methylophilaceae bacterium]